MFDSHRSKGLWIEISRGDEAKGVQTRTCRNGLGMAFGGGGSVEGPIRHVKKEHVDETDGRANRSSDAKDGARR
eukprot:jgi/Pico_ML_1/53862/g4332.t1